MNAWQTFRIAWEGLGQNKGRSFLTTLGVIIGVAAVITMLAISAGAEAAVADQINSLGVNLIMVIPSFERGGFGPNAGRPNGLSYSDINAIAQNVTGINGVSAEQGTEQTVAAGEVSLTNIEVVGTTAGFPEVRNYAVQEGRFLTDQDNAQSNTVVVLGYSIAQQLFGDPATGVAQDPLAQTVRIGTVPFTVIGVMAQKGVVGTTDFDARVYIPLLVEFQRYMPARFNGEQVRIIYVSAQSKAVMSSVESQITTLLEQRHRVSAASPDFTLVTQDSIIAAQESTTATFRNLLAWVAGVSLVVGGIGIMNIMLVSVTERTREIGLRQALGARPRDVQLQFLLEAVTLSLIGGLAGVIAGVGGSLLFNALGTMRTVMVWSSLPLAFGASAAIGVFFGYYPATKAARLDPIVALRHE
jgi:putative ABC transport system permease protein